MLDTIARDEVPRHFGRERSHGRQNRAHHEA